MSTHPKASSYRGDPGAWRDEASTERIVIVTPTAEALLKANMRMPRNEEFTGFVGDIAAPPQKRRKTQHAGGFPVRFFACVLIVILIGALFAGGLILIPVWIILALSGPLGIVLAGILLLALLVAGACFDGRNSDLRRDNCCQHCLSAHCHCR